MDCKARIWMTAFIISGKNKQNKTKKLPQPQIWLAEGRKMNVRIYRNKERRPAIIVAVRHAVHTHILNLILDWIWIKEFELLMYWYVENVDIQPAGVVPVEPLALPISKLPWNQKLHQSIPFNYLSFVHRIVRYQRLKFELKVEHDMDTLMHTPTFHWFG